MNLGNPHLRPGTSTRKVTERKIAKAAAFTAKVAPVDREIGGSYCHIAAALNERSIATARGGRWHGASITRLMRRVQ